MYKVVEVSSSENEIGIVDFNALNSTSSLETYWNKKIDKPSKRTMTFDWAEAKAVYDDLDTKYPTRYFEIRNHC